MCQPRCQPARSVPEDDVGNERNQPAWLGQCIFQAPCSADPPPVLRCGMITAIRIVGEGFGGSLGGVLADSEHGACQLVLSLCCSTRAA